MGSNVYLYEAVTLQHPGDQVANEQCVVRFRPPVLYKCSTV